MLCRGGGVPNQKELPRPRGLSIRQSKIRTALITRVMVYCSNLNADCKITIYSRNPQIFFYSLSKIPK